MQLQDYDHQLVVRGFDGYFPNDRYLLINLGYRDVANQFPGSWQDTSMDYHLNPGQYALQVGTALPLGIQNITRVMVKSPTQYRKHLYPEREERFFNAWLPMDLTIAANQSNVPDKYYYYLNQIYILGPPSQAMDFTVYYEQYLPDMVSLTQTTALPQAFDEVILDAALVRAHRRAHELSLASEAQQRVNAGVMNLMMGDVFAMEELQERVLPDDQWF